MKKLLLGLGVISAAIAPIVTMVSCGESSDNHILEKKGTATIKNGIGKVAIIGVPTAMLTEKQAKIALALIRAKYNETPDKSSLTAFSVSVSKDGNIKTFVVPKGEVSKINAFLISDGVWVANAAKNVLIALKLNKIDGVHTKTAKDVAVNALITRHLEGSEIMPRFRAEGKTSTITVDAIMHAISLKGYDVSTKSGTDVQAGQTVSYVFIFTETNPKSGAANIFYLTVSVVADKDPLSGKDVVVTNLITKSAENTSIFMASGKASTVTVDAIMHAISLKGYDVSTKSGMDVQAGNKTSYVFTFTENVLQPEKPNKFDITVEVTAKSQDKLIIREQNRYILEEEQAKINEFAAKPPIATSSLTREFAIIKYTEENIGFDKEMAKDLGLTFEVSTIAEFSYKFSFKPNGILVTAILVGDDDPLDSRIDPLLFKIKWPQKT